MPFFKPVSRTRFSATRHAIATVVSEPSGTATGQVLRFGPAESDAVTAGVRAAEASLDRARISGVLRLFDREEQEPYDDRNLDLIRAYAELRRALFHFDRMIPAKSLEAVGYSSKQVARINTLIDTLASGWAPRQGDRAFADAIPSPALRFSKGISHEDIARRG